MIFFYIAPQTNYLGSWDSLILYDEDFQRHSFYNYKKSLWFLVVASENYYYFQTLIFLSNTYINFYL